MQLRKLVLATILATAGTSAYAGNFVNLTTGNGTNLTVANGGLVNGANSNTSDPLFIETTGRTFLTGYSDTTLWADGGTGDIVETSINYRAFSGSTTINSGTLTLLDWHKTDNVTLLAGVSQATVYDFVYRDSSDNKLVFGSRFLNRQDNNQEFNFTYRYGFTGYSAATAWTFLTDSDLHLYQAGRTSDHSYNSSVPYDADAIRLKGDYSWSEGNPWSALDLVKTNATTYAWSDRALGFYQAGQEGQTVVGNKIAGFAPTTIAAVPETDTYAMLLAGLGIMGFVARRRSI
jgi:hypothetical protein